MSGDIGTINSNKNGGFMLALLLLLVCTFTICTRAFYLVAHRPFTPITWLGLGSLYILIGITYIAAYPEHLILGLTSAALGMLSGLTLHRMQV